MRSIDGIEFSLNISIASNPSACAALFRSATERFGFNTFACGVVDLDLIRRTVFYMIDWPEAWQEFYISSGFVGNDPVVTALRSRSLPFTWSDLRADRKFAQAGREALDRVVAEGWNEGFVVPFHHGDRRVGIVSLSGRDPVLTPDVRAYVAMLATLLQARLRSLVVQHGFAVPPAGLTSREIDCVRLVARGMSDNAIAAVMNIAPSTAHEFVEKAKRRLSARSRPELVAIAVGLGIASS